MAEIFTWVLVFVRTGAFMLLLPLFSSSNVPVRLRIALGAFLALFITPGLTQTVDLGSLHLWQLVFLLFREISIGLLFGYVCKMIFECVQMAGFFISTEIGLQTSTLITPDGVSVDVPGAVLNLLALMLFLSLDVHHWLLIAFQQSYSVLPMGGGMLSDALFNDMTARVAKLFLLAVQIAAPLIAISFLLSFVMMMLGRAVPQMNVFFESFTIRLLGGMIVFGFAIKLAAERISDYLLRVPQDMLEVGQILTGR